MVEKRPRGSIAKILGLTAGSFAAGTSAGVASSKLSSGDAVLPLKSFEWILEHGVAGMLLVVVFILCAVIYKQQQEIKLLWSKTINGERERHDERVDLEREYRDKVESLMREQIEVTQKTGAMVERLNQMITSSESPSDSSSAEG